MSGAAHHSTATTSNGNRPNSDHSELKLLEKLTECLEIGDCDHAETVSKSSLSIQASYEFIKKLKVIQPISSDSDPIKKRSLSTTTPSTLSPSAPSSTSEFLQAKCEELKKLNFDDSLAQKIFNKQISIVLPTEEDDVEILMLEKFNEFYQQSLVNFGKHHLIEHFERVFHLVLNNRICSETWFNYDYSIRKFLLLLNCLRILLRSSHFRSLFLQNDVNYFALAKLIHIYSKHQFVSRHLAQNNQILEQLLNILNKLLHSEPERVRSEPIHHQHQHETSGLHNGTLMASDHFHLSIKEVENKFFMFHLHVCLYEVIEHLNELSLLHVSLNCFIQLATTRSENRLKLVEDLEIADCLLVILQEYHEESKKYASKLLRLLCMEEKMKEEVSKSDGIKTLLSLLCSESNSEILRNIVCCLVLLSSYNENKKEMRLIGGIPIVLSILNDKNTEEETKQTTAADPPTGEQLKKPSEVESEPDERTVRGRFQIQSACCALVGELAFDETNSYQIANMNGVYLIASKLLIPPIVNPSSLSTMSERKKELDRLYSNVWRALRLLFSTERHRAFIKKIIPFSMFEQFVDVGNYKMDLKLYQPLVDSFYKLSANDIDYLREQVKKCNQSQAPVQQINEYAVYEMIGVGAFGRVYKVKKNNTNEFLALKEINTFNFKSFKEKSLSDIVNEVTIIRKNLRHPNIVKYLKTFKEKENLYIVMELIDGTPLSQHMRTLKEKRELWREEKIWHLFIQIVLALKYLHKEKSIVHRDLTPNNIMLCENEKITITDFGLAKLKDNDSSKMTSVVGTMFYSCPEILKNEPYNEKADIWALGCVLYEMCCLDPPYSSSNILTLVTKITQAEYDHSRLAANSYSSQIETVVRHCMIVDNVKRPDIIGVASLIAEKILNYTETVRFKCANLEKKLNRNNRHLNDALNSEKSKTNEFKSQTSLQSNSSGQTEFTSPSAPTTNSTINSDLANSFNSLKLSFKSTSAPSTKSTSTNKTTKPEKSEMVEFLPAAQSSSQEATVNSKLPPLKHPKAKIVVKKKNNNKEVTRENVDSLGTLESNLNSNGYKSDRDDQSNSNGKQQQTNQHLHKIQRSTSSSVIEKRSSSNSKSRPNSGNAALTPLYKKLRPVEDPILQILDQVRKILFISQLPSTGKKNLKKKIVDRYKRWLFNGNQTNSFTMKVELMKLAKCSNETLDLEAIGFKLDTDLSPSQSESKPSHKNDSDSLESDLDLEMLLAQNCFTYEHLYNIIQSLIRENFFLDFHEN